MVAEAKPARRDPILMTWLGLSVALNVIGMASLVDGLVIWADFIRQVVAIYRATIREPMQWAAQLIWPASWPRIPAAAFDAFVVWSCLFLSTNLALYRAARTSLLSGAYARVSGLGSFIGFLLVSVSMFITVPFSILRMLLTPNEYRHNVLFPYRRDMTLSVLYSLLFVAGMFILLLFVNYQVKRIAASA